LGACQQTPPQKNPESHLKAIFYPASYLSRAQRYDSRPDNHLFYKFFNEKRYKTTSATGCWQPVSNTYGRRWMKGTHP
jgi:hypothetical protein